MISEVPFDVEKLAALLMDDKRSNPSGYAMMTISEGASMVGGEMVMGGTADAYGHRKLGGIGQPVVKAKAKEMEKQFVARLRAGFEEAAPAQTQ